MSLCASLIQCHIDYACSAWYSGLSKRFKQKLQICQNKMVRFICGFSPRQSVNYSVFSSLNMLCVEDRVKQLRLNHVFNIYHNTAPSYLKNNFVIKTPNSGRQTRSCTNLDFLIPRVKTCESTTFYYKCIKDWNELVSLYQSRSPRAKTFLRQISSHFYFRKGCLGITVIFTFIKCP